MNVTFETKHKNKAGKHEWLTPPDLVKKLGAFDLDPCGPIKRPFEIAKNVYTIEDDGLKQKWFGRVFCNPPYGNYCSKWLAKCKEYKNCIALTFARTETKMFFDHVWFDAHSILFIKRRIKFYHVTGKQGQSAGAPSVLISYNEENSELLKSCSIEGKFLYLDNQKAINQNTLF